MHTTKKFISLFIALLFLLSFSACSLITDIALDTAQQMLDDPGQEQSHDSYDDYSAPAKDKSQKDDPPVTQIDPSENNTQDDLSSKTQTDETIPDDLLPEEGSYTSKDDVALYIHQYGHLPSNFITKKEAESLGWSGGSLEPYAPGKCIGGNRFGNYEGLLPEADGRSYTECDIDTLGAKSRGAKRIVFSNDGLIYFTDDHYESFTLLYGDE